jgi:hypothetical protein
LVGLVDDDRVSPAAAPGRPRRRLAAAVAIDHEVEPDLGLVADFGGATPLTTSML